MARLHEYQGKEILAAHGFKLPRGKAAHPPDQAFAAAKELGGEVVIKMLRKSRIPAGRHRRAAD